VILGITAKIMAQPGFLLGVYLIDSNRVSFHLS